LLEYFKAHFNLSKLETLLLSNNLIKVFDFGNREFIEIDLGYNQVTNVANYAILPNKTLFILLNNNKLTSIDSGLMSSFLRATHLDLSFNCLVSIKRLEGNLEFKTTHLNLSQNRLSSLGNVFNLPWPSPVLPFVAVDLSHNYFETLNTSFQGFVVLRLLFVSGNRLTKLVSSSFSGFRIAEKLDLSNNRLANIDETTFANFKNLGSLNLSSNLLKQISEHLFSDLELLTSLDLSNNSIEHIHPLTFQNLSLLKNVYIHMNNLKQIEKLEGFSSVRNIQLDALVLFANFTNVFNLQQSVKAKLSKMSLGVQYIKSVNFVSYESSQAMTMDSIYSCSATIFLIKHGILLDLSTDIELDTFFDRCQPLTLQMFI
jgi:Leucine-rich repeat (LRR) protein